jgi:hypothetical protein
MNNDGSELWQELQEVRTAITRQKRWLLAMINEWVLAQGEEPEIFGHGRLDEAELEALVEQLENTF